MTKRTALCFLAATSLLASLMRVGAATADAPSAVGKDAAPKPRAVDMSDAAFVREIAPLLQKYCIGCHMGGKAPAGVDLSPYPDAASVVRAPDLWQRVASNVRTKHMPPPGMPEPSQAERDLLVHWVTASGVAARRTAGNGPSDPGRVTLRRLNRAEYNNTLRDLLGADLRLADEFPSDDVGYGFDNIGDILSTSPLMLEKYLAAADKAARAVIVTPELRAAPIRFAGASLSGVGVKRVPSREGYRLPDESAELSAKSVYPEGEYTVRIAAFAQPGAGQPGAGQPGAGQPGAGQPGRSSVPMAVRLDGKEAQIVAVAAAAEPARPSVYAVRLKIPAGERRISVAPAASKSDSGTLVVCYLEVAGPLGTGPLPPTHRRILTSRPAAGASPASADACARKILRDFARRAYRRPVTPDEVERLVRCVRLARRQGDSFERGIQVAVQAALVSPAFLFRVETDPRPDDPAAKHKLSDYELASRLSYFLWSSMPDDELFTLAAKGALHAPDVLAGQVRRMLKDPKADALAQNFAGQWLHLRALDVAFPSRKKFPMFSDELRSAMGTETELFFSNIARQDRSLLDFIDARYTYLNEALALHYGVPGVKGEQFRRVALDGARRGGLLTQGSVLTVTSNPQRTSPVQRGKWILEEILGTPIPPPPPGVGELPGADAKGIEKTLTVRERLELHRRNPACASCHSRMDPLGFGLENYDAVGRWRSEENDKPVDASGTLPDGRTFTGPAQLKRILLEQKPLFVHNLSEKMLTYALGRGLAPSDRRYIDAIARTVVQRDYRFSALMTAVVQSEPFRMRRGDGGIIR